MRGYPQKVKDTILPLSKAESLPEAFAEWSFTGETVDREEAAETCPLCGQEQLRFLFGIKNTLTYRALWIGLQCILKLGIPVFENGIRLTKARTRKKLERHIGQMRLDSCLRALEKLAQTEQNDILRNAVEYYRTTGFLTPKIAFVVYWKLQKSGIDFSPSLFRINLKRARYKRDLGEMETSRVHYFWEALSPGQKKMTVSLGHTPPKGKN